MEERKYDEFLKELKEKRTVKTDDGKEVEVQYEHKPNAVKRSFKTGVPIWVGKTIAKGNFNGGTEMEVEVKCWVHEAFTYSQGRVVSTGRLLKELHLPTSLAEQVKE